MGELIGSCILRALESVLHEKTRKTLAFFFSQKYLYLVFKSYFRAECHINMSSSSCKVTSERLQKRQIEKETNINIDKRVVILFKDEMAYSMVNFNKIKEEHFVRKDTVHVKDGKGRCHEAQVVFIGEQEQCHKKLQLLEDAFTSSAEGSDSEACRRPENTDLQTLPKNLSSIKKQKMSFSTEMEDVINNERKKMVALLNSSPSKTESREVEKSKCLTEKNMEIALAGVQNTLKHMSKKLDTIVDFITTKDDQTEKKQCDKHQLPVFVVKKEKHEVPREKHEVSDEEGGLNLEQSDIYMHKGRNLLQIPHPPKEPARYATKLMSFLFTEEEMIGGLIGPIERKTTKTELDPERVQILRNCIAKKYSSKILEKGWSDIRTSCNQKGTDLAKKRKRQEYFETVKVE